MRENLFRICNMPRIWNILHILIEDMWYAVCMWYTICSGYAICWGYSQDMFRICERLTKSLCAVPCKRSRRRLAWGSTNKKVFFFTKHLDVFFSAYISELKKKLYLVNYFRRTGLMCFATFSFSHSSDMYGDCIWCIHLVSSTRSTEGSPPVG